MIQLSQVSLSELNEYRQSNDSTIAAWAAKRRTDEDLADLHQCVAEAEASLNDYERFIELDVRFHSLLARPAPIRWPSSSQRCWATWRRRRCAAKC